MNRRRAHWSYRKVDHRNQVIWIADDGGPVSVTNAAEQVCDEATIESEDEKDISGYRLFYKDTMGRWDELVHENGKFIRFGPGTDGFQPPT